MRVFWIFQEQRIVFPSLKILTISKTRKVKACSPFNFSLDVETKIIWKQPIKYGTEKIKRWESVCHYNKTFSLSNLGSVESGFVGNFSLALLKEPNDTSSFP